MEFNLDWLKFILSIVGSVIATTAAILTAVFKWHKKELSSEQEARKDMEKSLMDKLDDAATDVESIKKRLARGDVRMTKIEETLKHSPTQKQIAGIDRKLATLAEAQTGVNRSISLIEEYLLQGTK